MLILTGEEGSQQQDHDGNANRGIADIEYQKWTEVAEVKVEEVHDIAVERPVEDVSERSAEHHPERHLVDLAFLTTNPDGDANRDRGGERTSIHRPIGLLAFRRPSEIPSLWVKVKLKIGKK